MARRRKSSSSSDAAGVLLLLVLGAGIYVYNFVASHSAEVALAIGGIGGVWLAVRLVRSRQKAAAAASSTIPANVGPTEARISDQMSASLTQASAGPRKSVFRQPPAQQVPAESARSPGNVSRSRVGSFPVEVGSGPSTVISFRQGQEAESAVRITPIVDPPRNDVTPTKSWFRKDPSDAKVGNARWVRPGETVTIQGVAISSGMFYLGTEMRSEYSGNEYCLINPNLPISKPGAQSSTNPSYNPSYSDFKPSQRRAFLEWMANGRNDPDADNLVARVFLCGLEYRLFKQGVKSEIAELIREAERIIDVCGTRNTFSWSAAKFVSYANALLPSPNPPNPRFAKLADEFSPHVRVFIGSKLARGEPLTADDALVWAFAAPTVWLRTPAERCVNEFRALWAIRFSDVFRGFAFPSPKNVIALTYRATYGTFNTPLHGSFEKLPDISSDERTALKLKELVESCTNELDAYSRLLGRHPEFAGQPRASLLLPEELWAEHFGNAAKNMASALGDNAVLVTRFADLMEVAGFPLDEATPNERGAALGRFSSILQEFDVGIEPKGCLADATLSSNSPVTLFRLGASVTGRADDSPSNWRTVIDIALLAAGAAGPVSDAARGAAATSLANDFPNLEPMRVAAYAAGAEPPSSRAGKLIKVAGALSLVERQCMARCAVSASLVAGTVPPASVKFLERLYGALQFLPGDLYSALHRGEADIAPTASQSAHQASSFGAGGPNVEGQAASPSGRHGEVVIDIAKLTRAREATHAVSKILADVFVEDPAAEPATQSNGVEKQPASNGSVITGLDPAHANLLSIVLDDGPMEKKTFEAHAKGLKLMADGAIEHINDWGYDHFDEQVIEDGDTVAIAGHIRDRLSEMRGKQQ